MDRHIHDALIRIESRLASLESTVGTLRKLTWVAVSALVAAATRVLLGA